VSEMIPIVVIHRVTSKANPVLRHKV